MYNLAQSTEFVSLYFNFTPGGICANLELYFIMLPEIYHFDQLEGTYYVEFQISDGITDIEHWSKDSVYCRPEVLELVYPAWENKNLQIDFFCDNFLTKQECEQLNKGLKELKEELQNQDENDFGKWITNHSFSGNFLCEFKGKINDTLKNQITEFLIELSNFNNIGIARNKGLRILGI